MTLGDRKRSGAPLVVEKLQEFLSLQDKFQTAPTLNILQALGERLSSENRDNVITACSLLSSLDLSLEKILKGASPNILATILELMSGTDLAVTAEAASVLRSWSTDATSVRILYAHCIFPKLLQIIPKTLTSLQNISDIGGLHTLQLLEDFLLSYVLVLWAVVEEIPAALPQLNSSMFVDLVLLMLEKRTFFSLDIIIVLLRTTLCAREDNEALLTDIQQVRLDAHLESMLALDEGGDERAIRKSHLALLSGALLKLIRGQPSSMDAIVRLLAGLPTLPSEQDSIVAYLELSSDLFEILANIISDLAELPSSIATQAVGKIIAPLTSLFSADRGPLPLSLLAGCLQRAFACILNLTMSWSETDVRMSGQLWEWCRDQALFFVCDPAEMLPALSSLSELMKSLLLSNLAVDHTRPTLNQASLLVIRQICTQYSHDDSVVENLLSIPAILYDSRHPETLIWLNELAGSCFIPGRSWKTTLAVAEVCEELVKYNAMDPHLRKHLETQRTAVLEDLQGQLAHLDEDHDDELAYITLVIGSL